MINESVTSLEVNLNENLMDTYVQIIKSESLIKEVADNLEIKDKTVSELTGLVSAKAQDDSDVLSITVTSVDSELAAKIANEIPNVFFKNVKELYGLESAKVLDEAKIATKPDNICPVKFALIGAVVGIVISCAIVLVKDMLNDNIRKESEIDDTLQIPVISNIGIFSKRESWVVNNKNSANSEAFRMLLSNVKYKKKKVLLITSSSPGEGKSWVSANLAATYANSGKKTLLVDFDMRKGTQNSIWGLINQKGMAEMIKENDATNYEDYINESVIENLDIITKGNGLTNYSSLLFSETVHDMLEIARAKYDCIIIDGTPFSIVADGTSIIKDVDATLLVVKYDTTKKSELKKIKETITSMGGSILGAVFNGVPKIGKYYQNSYYDYNKNLMPTKTKKHAA